MRVLLGGIPLGCDNIGDEAIIAGVVKMLKESVPGVELTVATADPATAGLLGIPQNEAIVQVIACGAPPEEFDVAASPRLCVGDLMTWHGDGK